MGQITAEERKIIGRKGRRERNPQTGEELQIPAKKVPNFMPRKGLREAIK
ncbi:unnamed protein product [marine sediment metagenome]|uniref:DNA-binding protein n=1 Tax=marine sediment metagenome TaxID=412755 RepID=X1FGB2_9ZZZZ